MNQKGFSLVQVLISVGILGGVALGLLRMQDNSTKITKSMEISQSVNSLFQEMGGVISNALNCAETFKNQKIETTPKSINSIKKIKTDGSVIDIYSLKQKFENNQLELSNITFHETPDEFLSVKVTLSKTSKNVVGGKDITKEFRLNFIKDLTTNMITGCRGETSSGASLEIISGQSPGMGGLSGHEACASRNKKCVQVISYNFIAEDAKCNGDSHCARVCDTWYNQSLPGVENGSDSMGGGPKDNIHSCDARLGLYTTYLHPGVLRCNAYFSAYCI